MIGNANAQAAEPYLGGRISALESEVRTRLHSAMRTLFRARTAPLPPAIDAERKTMRSHKGPVLSYYDDRKRHGDARPLVLIHSINACASAYEMRPLFEHYRSTRPVYALDLPGFGFSERGQLPYTPESYAAEIVEFLARVKDRDGEAPDVVALSLSCELVARATMMRKDLVHRLAFISPTGFDAKGSHQPGLGARVLASPHWWSPLVFDAIVSRRSIRYFLSKSFAGPVDEGLQTYAYATSHQEGAEDAPLTFLSGKLFTRDIFDIYATLDRPVQVLFDQDGYVGFERLGELVERSPLWSSKRITPTRGLPQFERLEETVAAIEEFWRSHPSGAAR